MNRRERRRADGASVVVRYPDGAVTRLSWRRLADAASLTVGEASAAVGGLVRRGVLRPDGAGGYVSTLTRSQTLALLGAEGGPR